MNNGSKEGKNAKKRRGRRKMSLEAKKLLQKVKEQRRKNDERNRGIGIINDARPRRQTYGRSLSSAHRNALFSCPGAAAAVWLRILTKGMWWYCATTCQETQ
jgi:hypothetical protein